MLVDRDNIRRPHVCLVRSFSYIPLEISGNMAYTFFGVAIRLLAFYITGLIIASMYQAISPMSAHNRGEIVDYGAEYIQSGFKDLQSVPPGFDYFVQTIYQVMAQTLFTITIRYSINAAIFTGVFIAIALFTTIAVLVGSLSSLVVWLGLSLVKLGMGLVWLVEKLVEGIEKVLG